jgi:hypothetical protein
MTGGAGNGAGGAGTATGAVGAVFLSGALLQPKSKVALINTMDARLNIMKSQ